MLYRGNLDYFSDNVALLCKARHSQHFWLRALNMSRHLILATMLFSCHAMWKLRKVTNSRYKQWNVKRVIRAAKCVFFVPPPPPPPPSNVAWAVCQFLFCANLRHILGPPSNAPIFLHSCHSALRHFLGQAPMTRRCSMARPALIFQRTFSLLVVQCTAL